MRLHSVVGAITNSSTEAFVFGFADVTEARAWLAGFEEHLRTEGYRPEVEIATCESSPGDVPDFDVPRLKQALVLWPGREHDRCLSGGVLDSLARYLGRPDLVACDGYDWYDAAENLAVLREDSGYFTGGY